MKKVSWSPSMLTDGKSSSRYIVGARPSELRGELVNEKGK